MLGGIGPMELVVILFVVLLFFGAGKLPDIASGLGKGVRDFKKAMQSPDEPDPDEVSRSRPKEDPAKHGQ